MEWFGFASLWNSSPYNPDGLTAAEYFNPSSAEGKTDIGRPVVIKEKRQTFKGQAWITQDAPISLKDQLIPVFDILCTFNDLPWFDNLRKMLTFIPSGFPVRIDVPLFYVLTARVTFENINQNSGEGRVSPKNAGSPPNGWTLGNSYFSNSLNNSVVDTLGKGVTRDEAGKITIDPHIYDIPGGYQVTYSNMNTNLERRKQQRQQNDQELEMALNNSLLESIGISGQSKKKLFLH